MQQYILALDQGTTSSRAIIFDQKGSVVSSAQKEFTQFFPQSGWVEHDANEIWSTQFGVAAEAISKAGLSAEILLQLASPIKEKQLLCGIEIQVYRFTTLLFGRIKEQLLSVMN